MNNKINYIFEPVKIDSHFEVIFIFVASSSLTKLQNRTTPIKYFLLNKFIKPQPQHFIAIMAI